jgi:hypothetical protein
LAISGCNLVLREVLATYNKIALSTSAVCLKVSKNLKVSFLATSYPSVMILGWIPYKFLNQVFKFIFSNEKFILPS